MHAVFATAALLLAQAAPPPGASPPEYTAQVAPIFTQYCTGCHNGQDADGGLDLESYEGVLKGGKRGAAVVPAKSAESRLVLVLTGKARPKMPPKNQAAPTAQEIEVLTAWIDAGARGPAGGTARGALVVPKIEPIGAPRLGILAAAFSPDGRRFALARERSVELMDAASRERVGTLGGFPGPIHSLSFSADGTRLTAASGEPGLSGEARVMDLQDDSGSGSEAAQASATRVFRGHRDALYAAAVSPGGRFLATAGYDAEIKLWDADTTRLIRSLKGHQGAVYDLAFRPTGKILASASADRTVKLWDAETGARLETFSQPLKDQNAIAFSPDGSVLAAGGADNRIRVWKISADGAEGTNPILHARFAHEGAILRLVFSSDGSLLASSADDGTVKVWDAATLTERHLLERQPDWPAALAFSPDGSTLVVGRLDGTFGIYSSVLGAPIRLSSARPAGGPGAVIAAAAALLIAAVAEETPKPELATPAPRGVERGVAAKIKVTGKNLGGATEAKAHRTGVQVQLLREPAPAAGEIWVEVRTDAACATGPVELSVVTTAGESNRVTVHVDDLPQRAEDEAADDTLAAALAAGPAQLPGSIWGEFRQRGDVDFFAFDAAPDATTVFDLAAARVGSKSNAVLAILDENGRVLASGNDFDGSPDPLVAFRPTAKGRFVVRVADLEMQASPDHFYRLTAGTFPFVVDTYPPAVAAGAESPVELIGYNLPAGANLSVRAAAPGETRVPIDADRQRSRRTVEIEAVEGPVTLESEPNDDPANATPMSAPGNAAGRICPTDPGRSADSGRSAVAQGDVDLYRIRVRAGEPWIVETRAARRGSPCDTRVDVLEPDGHPVPRVLLQAVRDSYLTFRGVDSNQVGDFRLKNWEEMELNQFVYIQGEVIKLFRAPQGPDSGFLAYGIEGRRRMYFNTSASVHALDAPCYVVEPHPPGSTLVANGLPVFEVDTTNDDDGDRRLGSDSRLTFIPPRDGEFLVRVVDTSGRGGERYSYRLTVRAANPGFRASVDAREIAVAAGSGKSFAVRAERIDGFDGPIQVDFEGLPPGFTVSSPIEIQAGHLEASGVLFAAADAVQPSDEVLSKLTAKASAEVNGSKVVQPVQAMGKVRLEPKPKLLVRLEAAEGSDEISIAPGTTVPARLRIERNGHDDLVTFQVENLPHGVIVDDIGLSGVLIRKGENERQIFLTAAKWVGSTVRLCHAVENQAGGQASAPVWLRVRG